MLATPAAFAASNNNNNNQQPPKGQQTQQMQKNRPQSQQNGQAQQNQQNAQGKNQQNGQQSAQNNQTISPQSMSRGNVKQVQQALDKDGFKAGRADGRWGRETASAVKQFQQSKQLQPTGQLTEQTVADLGLDASKFQQPQDQR
jgi:hypothetical protein